MDRVPLPTLAQELELGRNEAIELVRRAGVNVARYGATLSPGQADKVRQRRRDEQAAEQQRLAKQRAAGERAAQAAAAQAQRKPPPPDEEQAAREVIGPASACACCRLVIATVRVDGVDGPHTCSACIGHVHIYGEAQERRLARLADHDERLRQAYAQMWQHAEDLDAERRRYRRSRNSWRGALVEVMGRHEERPVGCSCGAKSFPCATWRALEAANRGITRQVDHFLTLKDDEREAALYPPGHWDHMDDED
jgi:hypothetical protein